MTKLKQKMNNQQKNNINYLKYIKNIDTLKTIINQ